jgi:hypothetical protein
VYMYRQKLKGQKGTVKRTNLNYHRNTGQNHNAQARHEAAGSLPGPLLYISPLTPVTLYYTRSRIKKTRDSTPAHSLSRRKSFRAIRYAKPVAWLHRTQQLPSRFGQVQTQVSQGPTCARRAKAKRKGNAQRPHQPRNQLTCTVGGVGNGLLSHPPLARLRRMARRQACELYQPH